MKKTFINKEDTISKFGNLNHDRRLIMTEYLTLDKVLRLIDTTVEALETRLSGHSEQVAYVVYKIAQELGITDIAELKTLCKTAFLHDIGCYKTEDQNNLAEFEISSPHAHAAYGYAFLKHFHNIDVLPDLVKWHHTPWSVIEKYPENIPELACLIYLADRIVINLATKNDLSLITKASGTTFCPRHVDAFLRVSKTEQILEHLRTGIYKIEIRSFFSQFILTDEDILYFAETMSYALDFHSNTTVLHSLLVTGIAEKLSDFFSMTVKEKREIKIAASLHDIGKLIIPISILEKSGKLTAGEYGIMQYHAIAGYEILSVLCLNHIRDIASLHHETLDGTGYPFKLKADQLSFSSRLLAVADIGSALLAKRSYKEAFSKETVVSILQGMAKNFKIDQEIVNMFCNQFDDILVAVFAKILPIQEDYDRLPTSYHNALEHIYKLTQAPRDTFAH